MGKYFKYAVGEIILVIVGILIALSINNWNTNRILRAQEIDILKDLKIEMTNNLKALDTVIFEHEKSYKAALKLDALYEDRAAFEKMTDSAFFNLVVATDTNFTYNPEKGILNSIMSSGQINNLSNKKLKYLLASLEDNIADAFEDTNTIEDWRENINTKIDSKGYILENNKIIGWEAKRYYDNPDSRSYISICFINIRNQGLIEERQLRTKVKSMIELIEKEIENN